MKWFVAKSLEKLRDQVNQAHPQRNKADDGTIGDASHQTRDSDHNPWVRRANGDHVVTALDLTHDPAHGFDARAFAEHLRLARDPRIKYVISNHRIFASYPVNGELAWEWRPYHGKSPHDKHTHISVVPIETMFDNTKPWSL